MLLRWIKQRIYWLFEGPLRRRTLFAVVIVSAATTAALFVGIFAYLPPNLPIQPMDGEVTQGVSWNSWLEDANERDAREAQVNGIYRVNVDLARYAYRLPLSGSPDPRLYKRLKSDGEIRLLLQPLLIGPELIPAPGTTLAPQILALHANRSKPESGDSDLLNALQSGRISTSAVSAVTSLGDKVLWKVKAKQSGCGTIAISVWDESRTLPLDHIIVSVPVVDESAPDSDNFWASRACAGSQRLKAGLATLLASSESSTFLDRLPDAALHIFEIDDADATRSLAIFVDRARHSSKHKSISCRICDDIINSPDCSEVCDSGIYAWELASVLSSYASNPEELAKLITSSHSAFRESPTTDHAFEPVAQELALKVFSGTTRADQKIATRALTSLREISETVQDPLVIMRLTSSNGAPVYLPLGLLAASAQNPIVSKPFRVVQPVGSPTTGESPSCIDSWHVARPTVLEGIGGDARDLLRAAPNYRPVSGITLLPTHASLARYLAGEFTSLSERAHEAISTLEEMFSESTSRSEGLILLAHHHSGYLQFNEADRDPPRVSTEHIRRTFPSGSVALLAACATSGPTQQTRAIVDRLTRHGFESFIISPFAIDAEFGTRLTLAFEEIVIEERQKKNQTSLYELFSMAVDRASKPFNNNRAFEDMALQFQIVGNPNIRLCE